MRIFYSVISKTNGNDGTLGKLEVTTTNAKNRGLVCVDAF